jgi:hypothetical protein
VAAFFLENNDGASFLHKVLDRAETMRMQLQLRLRLRLRRDRLLQVP